MIGLARPLIRVAPIGYLGFLLWSSPAGALTRHVPSEYPTIAAALAASVTGDSIVISCGTYFERGLVMASGVTLRSQSGDPSCVIIDAGGLGRVMRCQSVSETTRIEGITFTGGAVSGYGSSQFGAGMLCTNDANPRILNCVFADNVAECGEGGGLACVDSSPVLEDCEFDNNQASVLS